MSVRVCIYKKGYSHTLNTGIAATFNLKRPIYTTIEQKQQLLSLCNKATLLAINSMQSHELKDIAFLLISQQTNTLKHLYSISKQTVQMPSVLYR